MDDDDTLICAPSRDDRSFNSIKLISVRETQTVYGIMLRTMSSWNYFDNWMALRRELARGIREIGSLLVRVQPKKISMYVTSKETTGK